MRTISVIILSADFFSSTFMTSSTQKENDRTTARRSRKDDGCLDALGTSGVEGPADAGWMGVSEILHIPRR